jgi:hypothetical protein
VRGNATICLGRFAVVQISVYKKKGNKCGVQEGRFKKNRQMVRISARSEQTQKNSREV